MSIISDNFGSELYSNSIYESLNCPSGCFSEENHFNCFFLLNLCWSKTQKYYIEHCVLTTNKTIETIQQQYKVKGNNNNDLMEQKCNNMWEQANKQREKIQNQKPSVCDICLLIWLIENGLLFPYFIIIIIVVCPFAFGFGLVLICSSVSVQFMHLFISFQSSNHFRKWPFSNKSRVFVFHGVFFLSVQTNLVII